MANSLSSKKRVRQNVKRNVINRARKSVVKTQIKHLETAISLGEFDKADEQFRLLTKKIDKITATSTMHKKTAARMKSRLARRLNGAKAQKA